MQEKIKARLRKSRLLAPSGRGREFTQPSLHLFLHIFRYNGCDNSRQHRMSSLKFEARPALGVEEEPRLDGLARPRVRLHLARVGSVFNSGACRQDLARRVALGQRLEVVGIAAAAAVGELNATALSGIKVPPAAD